MTSIGCLRPFQLKFSSHQIPDHPESSSLRLRNSLQAGDLQQVGSEAVQFAGLSFILVTRVALSIKVLSSPYRTTSFRAQSELLILASHIIQVTGQIFLVEVRSSLLEDHHCLAQHNIGGFNIVHAMEFSGASIIPYLLALVTIGLIYFFFQLYTARSLLWERRDKGLVCSPCVIQKPVAPTC